MPSKIILLTAIFTFGFSFMVGWIYGLFATVSFVVFYVATSSIEDEVSEKKSTIKKIGRRGYIVFLGMYEYSWVYVLIKIIGRLNESVLESNANSGYEYAFTMALLLNATLIGCATDFLLGFDAGSGEGRKWTFDVDPSPDFDPNATSPATSPGFFYSS